MDDRYGERIKPHEVRVAFGAALSLTANFSMDGAGGCEALSLACRSPPAVPPGPSRPWTWTGSRPGLGLGDP